MKRTKAVLVTAAVLGALPLHAFAAGTLTPVSATEQPIQIVDHHVNVVINNGFAKTEVVQTFRNQNAQPVEAIYAFPIPKSASLSEMSITSGEQTIHGEVVSKKKANTIYKEEKKAGNDAGLASKEGYKRFEFRVANVKPKADTRVRFVYYQPIEIDTSIGRYVYPLEEGGTDDPAAASFWTRNEKVENTFSVDLNLHSAWPVTEVRVPGLANVAKVTRTDQYTHQVKLDQVQASLNKDFVFYYRLQDNLPGRVEVIPYRQQGNPGTFMMVITPGVDLKPLSNGADYLFVLDLSGSMAGKLGALVDGVTRTISQLKPSDRFRIVTFANRANDLTSGWVAATPSHVQQFSQQVKQLRSAGSTNMYDGLQMALTHLDDDRATSLVLVTDAVTNTGVVNPQAFGKLMQKYDIRVFGFLMGNGANWPLMKLVSEGSGGFYARVSNADDIIGQVMLAKSKMLHESMHDVDVSFSGVDVYEVTDVPRKIYRGQQLVMFGRYKDKGKLKVKLKAKLTGQDKDYNTTFPLPAVDTDHPELERLWALNRIEKLEFLARTGQLAGSEADGSIESLGVNYQLVTDQTSMLVLSDAAFTRHNIERHNQRRVAREQQAQAKRRTQRKNSSGQSARNHRVDRKRPMFNRPAASGRGGGALTPRDIALAGILLLFVVGATWTVRRRS